MFMECLICSNETVVSCCNKLQVFLDKTLYLECQHLKIFLNKILKLFIYSSIFVDVLCLSNRGSSLILTYSYAHNIIPKCVCVCVCAHARVCTII